MRYYLFLVLFLACSCKQSSPKIITTSETSLIPDILISANDTSLYLMHDTLLLNSITFSGYLYQLYPNKKDTLSIEGYSKGVLNGISKKFYAGNQPMEYRVYLCGAKNGKQVSYWQNGNKRFEFNAKNDAYEGEFKEWSENGRLFHLAHFKNGQEEGVQKLWYDNGKLKANYVIRNGKRYGLLGTKNCTNVSDSIFIIK
ncbi:hypothetical protein BH11BAC3_BH11BAC3_27850 [soil metagenome]